ncbi:MAG: DUF4465 domain-containing protein [Verrucomicrobiae bacterium]|nr:DUF4465 domain-containing protein [Verrucomicrobiae bacterium]
MKNLNLPALAVGALLAGAVSAAAATATFEDLGNLAPGSAEDGFGLTPYATGTAFDEVENWNRFTSGGITFENRTIPAYGSWNVWAYSNRTDTVTPGFGNDLSSWAGGGADPVTGGTVAGGTYGIASGANTWIDLPTTSGAPVSVMVTNTTYAALSMRDGDAFSKKFGGASGADPDFFLLTILGENAMGSVTGSIDLYLADYRAADVAGDFIQADWVKVDLTGLGTDVAKLRFDLTSSDAGNFGINTPAFFAVDNLVVVPESSSMLLVSIGLGGWFFTRRRRNISCLVPAVAVAVAAVGSAAGQGISADDDRIVGWATSVTSIIRGPINAADHSLGYATFGEPENALGEADVSAKDQVSAPVVSLGDGGQITLSFDPPIVNGDGPDFAVFENGFSDEFLELGFVEVSSDGSSFKRFPASALRPIGQQIGPFDTVSSSGLHNLAGMYPAGTGTPFDLADLGMQEASHVRIVDVVGSIDPAYGSPDSEGRLVNDPFPTAFSTGGFDLDAIAVLHQVPFYFGTDEDKFLTFELWASAKFDAKYRVPVDMTGPMADPDSDGMTNLQEYAFWTDPTEFSVPITLEILHLFEEEVVEVRLPPLPGLRPDVDYNIESDSGMVYWQSHSGLTDVSADLESDEQEFFRLVVEPLGDDAD